MKGNIRSSPHLSIALSLQNDKYTKAEMFRYKEVKYYLALKIPLKASYLDMRTVFLNIVTKLIKNDLIKLQCAFIYDT